MEPPLPAPESSPPPRRSRWHQGCLGAIAFYTILPIPEAWGPQFQGVARYAPGVGVLLGSLLGLGDGGLGLLGMPLGTRTVLLVLIWMALTGGLHMDGVMDTADGLAVPGPDLPRRLAVMADSRTGAFGVMAALGVVLLKVAALMDMGGDRGWALVVAASWGRMGQVVAIARYPYLRETGKGAFHRATMKFPGDFIPGLVVLLGLALGEGLLQSWGHVLTLHGMAMAIALGSGAWFQHQLGGQTGDTYGAIVEWSEALILVGFACS